MTFAASVLIHIQIKGEVNARKKKIAEITGTKRKKTDSHTVKDKTPTTTKKNPTVIKLP